MGGWNAKTQPKKSIGLGRLGGAVATTLRRRVATVVDETEDSTSLPADQGNSDAGHGVVC
jgi:hypothetical protein